MERRVGLLVVVAVLLVILLVGLQSAILSYQNLAQTYKSFLDQAQHLLNSSH